MKKRDGRLHDAHPKANRRDSSNGSRAGMSSAVMNNWPGGSLYIGIEWIEGFTLRLPPEIPDL